MVKGLIFFDVVTGNAFYQWIKHFFFNVSVITWENLVRLLQSLNHEVLDAGEFCGKVKDVALML